MTLRISRTADGGLSIMDEVGALVARLPSPGAIETLGGARALLEYEAVTAVEGGATAVATAYFGGIVVRVSDEWTSDDGALVLSRSWVAEGSPEHGEALRLELSLELPAGEARFVAPGMMYSPGQWAAGGLFSFADHRLAYPIVGRHDASAQRVVSLARIDVALFDAAPDRAVGDQRFAQATDVGSVGFSTTAAAGAPTSAPASDSLTASWPYREADHSSMLDGTGSPATAFFPLSRGAKGTIRYRITASPAPDYDAAVRTVVDIAFLLGHPTPSTLPVTYEESVGLRLDSAAQTFFSDEGGFAGFRLNFDPEVGYGAQAKAFGASFADHAMGGSHDVLEYGFTGRQLNLAFLLAERDPDTWARRGAAVVDSFVRELATPSGFVHTLWDAGESRPLFAVGDPAGPVMHYLGVSDIAGTYTRMMAEAGGDLLLNINLHRSLGTDVAGWHDVALGLGRFFLRTQNDDGSWFRAYAPDETPIVDTDWFGYRDYSAKSATGTVVPFLTDLATATGDAEFIDAAERAVRFELAHHVGTSEYRGGTLDNPNLVDKEAAFVAMKALLAVADLLPDSEARSAYVDGARRAADNAISWHSLWAVPNITGTPLADADVRSVGWGGINSVWGVGVTDIYSLFFARDLVRLSEVLDDPRYADVAELVAASSLQLLASPGSRHGFADTGMQPEGIAFCPQGADDGLISKGDTWGGLGWPYTAGTFGLREYLRAASPLDHDRTYPHPHVPSPLHIQ